MTSIMKAGTRSKSVLYDAFEDTEHERVRLTRALDVIHVLENLKNQGAYAVLDELQIACDGRVLSDATQEALGKDYLTVFCNKTGNRSGRATVLPGVQGLIDEVLDFDVDEEKYSIHARRFLAASLGVISEKLKPQDVQHIKIALGAVKEAHPQDFIGMRQYMYFKLQDDFPAAHALLSHFKGVVTDGHIGIRSLEVLRAGFDYNTLEERFEL